LAFFFGGWLFEHFFKLSRTQGFRHCVFGFAKVSLLCV
jgi:hypothetical protein